ncbi:DUF4097 family beta strand repeat-containing protein [Streptomyces sp. NPDC053429]|uniref:DUF4097 family beta strand repeat-containing protein n=1 Tax=Streptomyces sp. NPDC053429 TaxID=3365702 RepID=UPI0037CE0399
MTKSISRRLATGATTAALCAATVSALLTGCSKESKTDQSSYDVNGTITSLRVDDYAGAIEVVPGTDSAAKVTEKYAYTDGRPQTTHSLNGGELVLKNSGCGPDADTCSVRYRVEIPANATTHLTLGGGDITVRGLSGTTYATSEGGSVAVADSSAKTVTARVGGGDVTVTFAGVPDAVDASTEGGDATVRLPQGAYAVDATTEGGRRAVGVKTDPSSPHKVRAHTEGGDVDVEATG